MLSVTDIIQPSTWVERVEKSEVSTKLNLIYHEVIALFKTAPDILEDDNLKEEAVKKMLMAASVLPMDTVVTLSPINSNIEILHHTMKFGGDLQNKEIIYFSLIGTGTSTVPVVYSPKSILSTVEIAPLPPPLT